MLRYCSDMMYSGHTFVVTCFGLGLYELIRIAEVGSKRGLKIGVLTLLVVVTVCEQFFEVLAVEMTHFHYTMDVIMALVLTFLMYTNGAINIAAKQWVIKG